MRKELADKIRAMTAKKLKEEGIDPPKKANKAPDNKAVKAARAAKPKMSFDQLAKISRCQKLKAQGLPCNEFTKSGEQ